MRWLNWILVLSLFPLLQCAEKAAEKPKNPNILLVLTDDQGWGDVAFHSNDSIDTPNLDRLAREAVEFTRFYVSPVCAPTRASLLTGRYHLATGVSWVTHRKEVMRRSELTLAELLEYHGYRTGLFGKWHNGKQFPHHPNGQGFKEFLGFTEGHFNNYSDPILDHNQNKKRTSGYITDILTDAAINFMSKDDPFLCYVAYNTPHSPFQVPDRYFDKYKAMGFEDRMACIYGMVENLDENLGRLLEALKATGKEKETIVIFLSDNGPNGHRYNGGFKGIKAHVDEGGVRVPFLMKYPRGTWDQGLKVPDMAAHIDLLPTLAGLVGIQIPDSVEIHGKNLVPLIEGDPFSTDRSFFTHQAGLQFDTLPGAVRTDQYLLTLKHDGNTLYDLIKDPYQKQNLADSLPGITSDLKDEYYRWFEQVTAAGLKPEPVEVGHPEAPTIEFPAQEADFIQNLNFMGEKGWANDWLMGWEENSKAQWKMKVVEEGQYEVAVQMAANANKGSSMHLEVAGQELSLGLSAQHLKIPIESPDRVRRKEVYEYQWPAVKLGTVRLFRGMHEMTLSASQAQGLEVKSIQLKSIHHDF